MVRVMLADDHATVRFGLSLLISAEADLELVGVAADGADAVALALELAPDVVLMDLSMPVVDGITAMARIRAAQPRTRLLALTSDGRRAVIRDALAAGADGYLLKDSGTAEILEAIRAVHDGGRPMSPAAASAMQ